MALFSLLENSPLIYSRGIVKIEDSHGYSLYSSNIEIEEHSSIISKNCNFSIIFINVKNNFSNSTNNFRNLYRQSDFIKMRVIEYYDVDFMNSISSNILIRKDYMLNKEAFNKNFNYLKDRTSLELTKASNHMSRIGGIHVNIDEVLKFFLIIGLAMRKN